MRFELGKCDVCNLRDAIGVASTSVPFSCAYCAECATAGADPEIVMVYFAQEHEAGCGDFSTAVTWYVDRFITFDEWYKLHKQQESTP